MKLKLTGCFFAFLEALMLGAQLTTLVSTYWTSWDLRFNWTQAKDFSRRVSSDGQLISEGHAGLWSRCVRVYEAGRREPSFNCLHNYDFSNGSLKFTFGKACKTATAALCVGDAALILGLLAVVLAVSFRAKTSATLVRLALVLLLLQGLICFAIPLTYLSGNMSELIDQLSTAYGMLQVVSMIPWYTHDWAFWTQVGLAGGWVLCTAVFVVFYAMKHTQNRLRQGKYVNGKSDNADTEMESLRS